MEIININNNGIARLGGKQADHAPDAATLAAMARDGGWRGVTPVGAGAFRSALYESARAAGIEIRVDGRYQQDYVLLEI